LRSSVAPESADAAPEGQESEIRDPILRKECGQHHDHDGAHDRSDHPEPAFAQRSAELRLAHDCRGGAGPKRIVELEPEGDEQRQTNGSPKAQAKSSGSPYAPRLSVKRLLSGIDAAFACI
jgi:hypothetical protein